MSQSPPSLPPTVFHPTNNLPIFTPSRASYGAPFAAAGGGVWVTELATTGINIWFYSRADIPTAVSSATDSIDVSTLGTPAASYPSSSCDIDAYFGSQQLVLDITLCGSWAGQAATLAETCPALEDKQTCYTTVRLNQSARFVRLVSSFARSC